jgi:predicted Ser/Thr protein kinase
MPTDPPRRDADPTVAQHKPTMIRDDGATQRKDDATERKNPDLTERKSPDLTERKNVDATERKSDLTERAKPATDEDATQRQAFATLKHAPEATIRMQAPPTAARTLRAPDEAQPLPDRTEIIADRLVKSLDDTADPHHGQLQPGAVIKKRFVLDALIGKGGMGLVFSALDRRKEEARDPNPRVALKVLNADFQRHPQSLMALQREARKAQTLAHPNVVTVFDFDRDGDAIYMTMELLKGRALEKLVKEARGKGTDPKIALPIIRGIAEGLAYAHRKGIVHSDLKPGNIFVLDDGTPKILDFGIARAVPNSVATQEEDIFDAGMLGAYTEAYATFEMVEGVDPHPADDMYSLGIIAYELLTGFHPYQRHSAPKARELGVKPPPLKGLKLREARALERCLSFDRKQRPQDAAEFLKLFRGVTGLQKALIAATAVLTVAAGYATYEYYREAGPAVPFSQLSATAQQEFRNAMTEGDAVWVLYEHDHNPAQVADALVLYSNAYDIHPRNREASKALAKAGDEYLKRAEDAADRRKRAETLLQGSAFFRRYSPVLEATR